MTATEWLAILTLQPTSMSNRVTAGSLKLGGDLVEPRAIVDRHVPPRPGQEKSAPIDPVPMSNRVTDVVEEVRQLKGDEAQYLTGADLQSCQPTTDGCLAIIVGGRLRGYWHHVEVCWAPL